MNVLDVWERLNVGTLAGAVIIILSLVQISPLKLNPWDKVLAWLGNKLNGAAIEELQKQVRQLWINDHRLNILTFARECRSEISHSPEEWAHCLNLCEEYEKYCDVNDVTNGVVRENTKYIRDLYQELAREHKI